MSYVLNPLNRNEKPREFKLDWFKNLFRRKDKVPLDFDYKLDKLAANIRGDNMPRTKKINYEEVEETKQEEIKEEAEPLNIDQKLDIILDVLFDRFNIPVGQPDFKNMSLDEFSKWKLTQ